MWWVWPARRRRISIHSLLTKGDRNASLSCIFIPNFNPLPSHEGRQIGVLQGGFADVFQSTPFSRRETSWGWYAENAGNISIHSLLTKGDLKAPANGLTSISISIHSLLTKGDGNLYQFFIPFSLILSFILTVSLLYPPQIHLFAPIFFANCTIHLRCESPGVSVCT